MLEAILIQVLSGVSRGMILFIVASGLSLIFGVLRVANFAHGSLYMIAAFVSFSVTRLAGGGNAGFLVSIVIAPLVVALLGAAIEAGLLRRIAGREHFYQLIVTFAITLIVADGIKMIWGGAFHSIPRPPFLAGSVQLLGQPFPSYYVMLMAVGLAIAALLALVLERTRFGKTLRAAVADGDMVSAIGVDVPRLQTAVFALGAWLAGIGGALAAPIGSISIGIDSAIIIECFAVVIIGGVGSIGGALAGALLIGIVQSLGIMVAPVLASSFVYILLCGMLLLRPQGLAGRTA